MLILENKGLLLPMLYALISGLVALALLLTFSSPYKPPKWHKSLCAVGFVVAIGWISTIADEVVGILRAFGAILGVSEAILGVTVFAMVYFVDSDLIAGEFFIRFRSRCHRGENGLSHDGHVCMLRRSNAKYDLSVELTDCRYSPWCRRCRSLSDHHLRGRISRPHLTNLISLDSIAVPDPVEHVNRRSAQQVAHDSSIWNLSCRVLHNQYRDKCPCRNSSLIICTWIPGQTRKTEEIFT
jgi:hypothetical protein